VYMQADINGLHLIFAHAKANVVSKNHHLHMRIVVLGYAGKFTKNDIVLLFNTKITLF
jgi:phosphopantothenoylcysteine synthetase/decarboxylase